MVSPMTLNDHGFLGARMEYQRFAFHLSFCLRAAALADAPLAIETTPSFGGCPVCGPSELEPVFERNAEGIAAGQNGGLNTTHRPEATWDCMVAYGGFTPVLLTT